MEKYSRSKSSREGGGGGGVKQQPNSMHDLRSYSTSYYNIPSQNINLDSLSNNLSSKDVKKMKKSRISASSSSSSSSSRNWNMNMDPELQRKKRVAGYKAYGVEGKMKTSFRSSFKWIKDTCSHVVQGFW